MLIIKKLLLRVLLVSSVVASAETKNGFDLSQSLVPANQILQGGPNRDGVIKDASGKVIELVNGFWFAWYAFHPDTAVFSSGGSGG